MTREPQIFNALNGVTGGVWREGDAIIKHLRRMAVDADPAWIPSEDPDSWLYWRREALVYETQLPQRLGLIGPELLRLTEVADGVELRIRAFDGRTAGRLTIDDLTELAESLGRSQGADERPSHQWLSRGFLRQYSTTRSVDDGLRDSDAHWQLPLVVAELREPLARLHANRPELLALSEALPRTLCHLDVFPNNIFATNEGVGLIDWAFAGDGAIGEDVGNMIPDSVFDLQFPATQLDELESSLVAAYLHGLRTAGWIGDDRLAVLGVHASAVKYDWLVPRLLAQAGHESHASYGGVIADSQELFQARWAGLALMARWADLAMVEAEALGLR